MSRKFTRKETRVSQLELKNQILSCGVDSQTAELISEKLIQSNSIYKPAENEPIKLKFRISNLILYPLITLSMPIKWLFTGTAKYDANGAVGRFLLKITGKDKDVLQRL